MQVYKFVLGFRVTGSHKSWVNNSCAAEHPRVRITGCLPASKSNSEPKSKLRNSKKNVTNRLIMRWNCWSDNIIVELKPTPNTACP